MSIATVQRPPQVTDSRSQVAVGLRRFRPRLALGYQRELHALVTRLQAAPLAVTEILAAAVEAADARYEDLAAEPPPPTATAPSGSKLDPTCDPVSALRYPPTSTKPPHS